MQRSLTSVELVQAHCNKVMAQETVFQHTCIHAVGLGEHSSSLLLSFTSAELNQRALVGRAAAVFSVADPTVEQSINETMRYSL